MRIDKYLVEFFGTLFFLYIILTIGKPLAVGLALAVAMYLGMTISGGMFNPAVSIMMTLAGRMPVSELMPYIVAQVLGGVVAFELYRRVR